MSRLQHAKGFRDLAVYQRADRIAAEIFDLTNRFPKEERYSLTDQIRRSSRSVGAQIAEAWGKRRYQRSFIAKLVDADAEQLETQNVRPCRHQMLIGGVDYHAGQDRCRYRDDTWAH
jgi:four helix bundle protein